MAQTALDDLLTTTASDLATELRNRAYKWADHPFLIWVPPAADPVTWTYGRFERDVEATAAGLSSRGLGVGDRIMVVLNNCPELVVTFFACARIGAVAVLVNTRSAPDELAYFGRHCGAALVVTEPAHVEALTKAVERAPIVCVEHDGGSTTVPQGRTVSFGALKAPGVAPAPPADPALDLWIQYTSGTTARPKGVVMTHANALWAGMVNARHTGLRQDDRYLIHLPLFHSNALSYSLLATFWAGATAVVVPKFSASGFWEVSVAYGCTVTSMIPFCVRALDAQPIPQHRFRTWGSPFCDPPWDARFGVKSVGWWGMTETISHGVVGDVDLPNTPMSCGRPAAEYDVRVVGADGSDVVPGEVGELRVRGRRGVSLFSRYLDDPEATDRSFDEWGYLMTGDLVELLPDGHIRFRDRLKDMLKVGGENVAASEVERVLLEVDGIVDAAVVADRDERLGEVPVGFVVLAAGVDVEDVLDCALAACRERLADFKVPRRLVNIDELPRATLNKVAKNVLRERLRSAPGA